MERRILWDRHGSDSKVSREAFRFLAEVIGRTSSRVAACLRRARMVLEAGTLLLECAPEDSMLLRLVREALEGAARDVFGPAARLVLCPVPTIPSRATRRFGRR